MGGEVVDQEKLALALILDLYAQVGRLSQENLALRAELAKTETATEETEP